MAAIDIQEFTPEPNDTAAPKAAALEVLENLVAALVKFHRITKAEARATIREALLEL